MNWPTRKYLSSSADSVSVMIPAFFSSSSADPLVRVGIEVQVQDQSRNVGRETRLVRNDDLLQDFSLSNFGGF